jgi:hypothetical protein
MPDTGPTPIQRKSHISMLIECSECGQKMILHVGLVGQATNNSIECLGCHNSIVPILPGPIVDGPFGD